jgi:cobalamin synthase
MAVFWVVVLCSLVEIYSVSEDLAASMIIALMMEAARTSEMLVNFYHTTRRYNPEDSHLRTHHRENLKSYLICYLLIFILPFLPTTKQK